MSCSSTRGKSIDIEDIYKKNDEEFSEVISKNGDIYRKMVFELYEWTQDNCNDTHFKNNFNKKYQSVVNSHRIYAKKPLLIFIYRKMIENDEIENDALFWSVLQKRPARNADGITNITLLTSPNPTYTVIDENGKEKQIVQSFSCKHNCYYCPDEPGQPRSYLKKEPAVARANRNEFYAVRQMIDRMDSLLCCGQEIDKLEIIIEGGTYTEYPKPYLEQFHRDIVWSANTYFDNDKREPLSVEEEIKINETARVRIIGVCIETRPDAIWKDDEGIPWVHNFRKWGVTRIQLGIQTTNDAILKKINRGHTTDDAVIAIEYLKNNCFKIDGHIMPDLPGSSPELDYQLMRDIFCKEKWAMDQIKIYPCETVPWTVIKKWHDSGKYKPYAQTNERELLNVVKYGMELCPPWIRLPRVIRDIPLTYIEGGNMYPNLRQMLNAELENEGKYCKDLRTRSIGRNPGYNIKYGIYLFRSFKSSNGTEYFISKESLDERVVYGYLRLRIPSYESNDFPVLHKNP